MSRAGPSSGNNVSGTRIGLQDADGIFLDIAPEEPEKDQPGEEHGEATGGKSGEEDLQTLRKTLQEVSNEKETLQAEVNSLKEALASES